MASREITAFGFLSVSKEITGGSVLFAAACGCFPLADVVYCCCWVFFPLLLFHAHLPAAVTGDGHSVHLHI